MIPIASLLLAGALAVMSGCATPPPQVGPMDLMKPGPDAQASQQVQRRRFSGVSEAELLAASLGVLQDLGFQVTKSEAPLGVVTGRKPRPAEEALADFGKQFAPGLGRALLQVFSFGAIGDRDLSQQIRVANAFAVVLATQPVGDEGRTHDVRVVFYLEYPPVGTRYAIHSPGVYRDFFALLSATLARSRSGY